MQGFQKYQKGELSKFVETIEVTAKRFIPGCIWLIPQLADVKNFIYANWSWLNLVQKRKNSSYHQNKTSLYIYTKKNSDYVKTRKVLATFCHFLN